MAPAKGGVKATTMANEDLPACGLDHSKLQILQNFKDEDSPAWFAKGAKFHNKKCHVKSCPKLAKPHPQLGKAWYCREYDKCFCIMCPLCYSGAISAAEALQSKGKDKTARASNRTRKPRATADV